MVYDGNVSLASTRNSIHIIAPGFDADSEVTGSIDLIKYLDFLPKHYGMIVTTAGVAAFDMILEGSHDDGTYETIIQLIAKNTEGYGPVVDYTSATGQPIRPYRYIRIRCVDVTDGAAQTLAAYVDGVA